MPTTSPITNSFQRTGGDRASRQTSGCLGIPDEVDQNNNPENQSQDLGGRLKETLEREMLPRLQDSGRRRLDRMQKEGWRLAEKGRSA